MPCRAQDFEKAGQLRDREMELKVSRSLVHAEMMPLYRTSWQRAMGNGGF